MTPRICIASSLIVTALTSTASAQWTVVNLHPAGAGASDAAAVYGGQQVGAADDMGGVSRRACLWSGTAASWVDLNPVGATLSEAYAVHGGQQVGYADDGGGFFFRRASLWSGTAASWVDLSPAGAIESQAYGMDAVQQVGYAYVGSSDSAASLWSGTAASWVNLHPAGAAWSAAYGVDGGYQVGYAVVGGVERASLWNDTAASWVNLHPAGSTFSIAHAVAGGQQVGVAYVDSSYHASLWGGTAASWVDLNPAESTYSIAYGVHGDQQVGTAMVDDAVHASFWSGSAASWVDLNGFLPSGFTESNAFGIWHDGAHTYVVGDGYNSTTGRYEALMWVSDPCALNPWSGLLQPINADGSSIFKLGSTVPVRFRLTGECESNTTLQACLYAAQLSAGVVGTEQEAVSTSAADSGNLFRYLGGQYIFNLGTSGLSAGTWRLRIDMLDGVERTVLISLR